MLAFWCQTPRCHCPPNPLESGQWLLEALIISHAGPPKDHLKGLGIPLKATQQTLAFLPQLGKPLSAYENMLLPVQLQSISIPSPPSLSASSQTFAESSVTWQDKYQCKVICPKGVVAFAGVTDCCIKRSRGMHHMCLIHTYSYFPRPQTCAK